MIIDDEQHARLRLWGGQAVNWLHGISHQQTLHGDKTRVREVADNLFQVLKELKELQREAPPAK